jgi:hypothetical protein
VREGIPGHSHLPAGAHARSVPVGISAGKIALEPVPYNSKID